MNTLRSLAARTKNTVISLVKETADVVKSLFSVLIPAIVIVKICQELGIVRYLALLLEPLMQLFGLPGEMAIVWTTAMVTNIYGGIAVLMMLPLETPLTVAQMTVLATMIAIAHALPVELALTHRVGGHALFLGPLRILMACVAGAVLNQIYNLTNTLQSPAVIRWSEQIVERSILDWAINQLNNLALIALVLFSLLAMMRLLKYLRITDALGRLLQPLLIVMGISQKGASIAVFGLLAGITFGSGLLLAEAEKHEIPPRDVLLVLTFLSLCHAIIEDTTLMLLLGADLSGVLAFRLILAITVLAILSRLKSVDLTKFQS